LMAELGLASVAEVVGALEPLDPEPAFAPGKESP
jgi:hypothetical protein